MLRYSFDIVACEFVINNVSDRIQLKILLKQSFFSRSGPEDQLHAVQLSPWAALWEAPRQWLCGGLLGAVRVQPWLCSARFHGYTVRERARQPGAMERHLANLPRYLKRARDRHVGPQEHFKMPVQPHSERDHRLFTQTPCFISYSWNEKMPDLLCLSPDSDKALI